MFAKLQQNPDSYKLGGGFLDDVLQHVFRCIGRQIIQSAIPNPAIRSNAGGAVDGEDEPSVLVCDIGFNSKNEADVDTVYRYGRIFKFTS